MKNSVNVRVIKRYFSGIKRANSFELPASEEVNESFNVSLQEVVNCSMEARTDLVEGRSVLSTLDSQ